MCNDKMKVDAIKAIRNDIIQKITKKPSDKYELGSLRWPDAKNYFGKEWDYAGFYLDLQTKKLYVHLSTHPEREGVFREDMWNISETEFHMITKRYEKQIVNYYDISFQYLECKEDWNLLFDAELQSAVNKALEIVKKEENERKEAERIKFAIVLGDEYFCRTPEMSFQKIVLEENLTYNKSIVKLKQDEKKYRIYYENISKLSPCKCSKYECDLTSAEAVWLETTVDETMRNKDVSTQKSLVGGCSMNISIKKSGHKPYEYIGKPINEYTKLNYMLERLAKYGSKRLDEIKN